MKLRVNFTELLALPVAIFCKKGCSPVLTRTTLYMTSTSTVTVSCVSGIASPNDITLGDLTMYHQNSVWVQYLPPTASLLSRVMLPDSIQSAHHLWSPCEQWHLVVMFVCILYLWCVHPPIPALHDCVTPFPRRFQTVLWNICLKYFKSGRKGGFHVVLSKVFHQ